MPLPGGWAGTDATVAKMSEMATGKWGSRSPKIRALAINVVRAAGAPEKNYTAEMVAIHNYVRDNIRYTKDVNGQETLCYPEDTAFNTRAGDCDDKSLLEAALLGSIGIASRFVTIGLTPFKYDHVYLHARPKDKWIALDPIMRDKPAGWEVPNRSVQVRKVFPENIPTEMAMSGLNGPLDWYVGYQGGGFTHSHLSPSPQPGRKGPAAPYVIMDSMMDDDRSVAELSRNPIAFPQNDMAPMKASIGQLRPRLIDLTLPPAGMVQPAPSVTWAPENGGQMPAWAKKQRSRMSPEQVQARIASDNGAASASEDGGLNPTGMNGHNGVLGPDELAAMAHSTGIDSQLPYANMQRPAIAQVPEGIDSQFLRPQMVLRTDKGDSIVYKGLYSLAEQPPIRPYDGLSGVYGTQRGARRGALPGMGMMPARSISGPGVSELADLADGAADAPATAPTPVASQLPKVLGLAAVAVGVYLLFKQKRK